MSNDCQRCGGSYWVCEDHTDVGWFDGEGCPCRMPGMPCPDCNPETPGVMPLDSDGTQLVPNLLCPPRVTA